MTLFFGSALVLILITLFICIRAIMFYKRPAEDNAAEMRKALLLQKLDELDNDLANGTITNQEAENTRAELQRALASSEPASEQTRQTGFQFKQQTSIGLIVFIPVFVLLFYSYLGRPDLISGIPEDVAQQQPVIPEQIEKMVGGLEQRLQENPEDQEGWEMLFRSYMVLQRYDNALEAAEKLYKLNGETPETLLRYVDALAMANDERLAGKPTEYINRILELEPDNASALWLAGMSANERGEPMQALEYWEKLLPRIEDGSEPKQQLIQMIAATRAELGLPTADAVDPDSVAITVNVYLAPDLSENINDNAMLFVYARSEDGNSMPIAVVREPVADFPVQVTLNNTNIMIPTRQLADFDSVQLIARVSNSGQAKPENGDLIGAVSNISPLTVSPIDLVIREKIKL